MPNYSKRAMALDQIEVMKALGFDRFAVVGHDRGARVTWRMAIEHPQAHHARPPCIDIVPLPYSMVTREFATGYYHWFFLIQPAPFPETLIGNSAEFYLRSRFLGRAHSTLRRKRLPNTCACFNDPATIHATCEDYRAGATHRHHALGRNEGSQGHVPAARAVGRARHWSAASTT